MNENNFRQFDICEAKVKDTATAYFLILDGEMGLRKASDIICAPLFQKKTDRYYLYVDCPVGEKTYLAALDGVQPIKREWLKTQQPIGRLEDEKAQKVMGQTLQLLMMGK